ncbi:hypothetical protein C8R45DRAFT_1209093 [Mycena sanguinolenta]|nr:hypothetical protein C8R45DRAFT_1209093 [Mycena sanguinolenta]
MRAAHRDPISNSFHLEHFRRAYNVLFRDGTRTFELQAGDAEQVARQINEVIQLFTDAEQHRGLFPEPEFELLQTYITQMLQGLYATRPVPGASSPDVDPEIPPSEMHRGLQVPEIVWMVVSQLDRSQAGTAALAALAQCHIFHGPALDALWREQFTIRNLINCMSEGLWVIEMVDGRLRRPIRVEDWDRVLEYSHCGRYFRLDRPYARQALSEVFEVIRQSSPCDYLLPNLEILDWRPAHNPTRFSDIDLEELRLLQLVDLNVANSLISDALSVARFISAVFIKVTKLVTALEDDSIEEGLEDAARDHDHLYMAQAACHKLWKEAEAFLPVLNDIRAEEFHWGEHQCVEQLLSAV